jgi:cytidylate kinase
MNRDPKFTSPAVQHESDRRQLKPRHPRRAHPLHRLHKRNQWRQNGTSLKHQQTSRVAAVKESPRRLCRRSQDRTTPLAATGKLQIKEAQRNRSARPEENMTSEIEVETANQAGAPTRAHLKVVAIDGPAAAGKTTVASRVAARLGAMLFDTGALYRAVTLAALRAGISETDSDALASLTRKITIDLAPPSVDDGRQFDVLMDGEDVTWAIRGEPIDSRVSAISAQPRVRQALLPIQRKIASAGPVVMVGRDIGSVVIPDAGVKIYLDASAEERARRRYEELVQRGKDVEFSTVLSDIHARDAYDSTREVAPLRIASGADVVSTDSLTIDEVVDRIVETERLRWQSAGIE